MLHSRALVSSLLVLCLVAPLALAKQNLNEWDNVRILEASTYIVVKTKAGEQYEGKFKEGHVIRLPSSSKCLV